MRRARRGLRISIVGAGTVGTALAILFARSGQTIVSVISRSRSHARRLAKLVHPPSRSASVRDIDATTDLIILTTSDEAIRPTAGSIARFSDLRFHELTVCHTSGALTSDELLPLARKGARTFSFHPIQAFTRNGTTSNTLEAVRALTFGIEGPPAALRFGAKLAHLAGASVVTIPKEQKILYHLTCVFAANYLTALLGVVDSLAVRLGNGKGLQPFEKLTLSSVTNALNQTPARALTGPIARGSDKVIRRHLKWLAKNREYRTLYRILGLQALRLARKDRKISPSEARRLSKILHQGR